MALRRLKSTDKLSALDQRETWYLVLGVVVNLKKPRVWLKNLDEYRSIIICRRGLTVSCHCDAFSTPFICSR